MGRVLGKFHKKYISHDDFVGAHLFIHEVREAMYGIQAHAYHIYNRYHTSSSYTTF